MAGKKNGSCLKRHTGVTGRKSRENKKTNTSKKANTTSAHTWQGRKILIEIYDKFSFLHTKWAKAGQAGRMQPPPRTRTIGAGGRKMRYEKKLPVDDGCLLRVTRKSDAFFFPAGER